jgi:hypothetical protein
VRRNYKLRMDRAAPGLFEGTVSGASPTVKTCINGSAGQIQKWTIVPPVTVTPNVTYELDIDNIAKVKFATGATPTGANLIDGLLNAFRSNPIAMSLMVAEGLGGNLVLSSKNFETSHSVIPGVMGDGDLPSASITQPNIVPALIEFGLFVARSAGDNPKMAKLPSAASDIILGITLNPKDIERNAIGTMAKTGFYPNTPMDVCQRCNGADGIWTVAIEPDITEDDPIHVKVGGPTAGRTTKQAAGNIAIGSMASFQSRVERLSSGVLVVLVRFNKP